MADSASELESDASSMDGSAFSRNFDPEVLQRRIDQLQQDNRTLRVEVETSKLKIRSLTTENRDLRAASVTIQQKAEQEEEFISNTLLKKIQALKKEKESLAINFEQEEESITNDLQRKLNQIRSEKIELETAREREQECQVSKLMRRIEKLEGDVDFKQRTLEQIRREKIELENTLEQEQEALVNRLWKKMEHSEAEKRMLGARLEAIPAALHIFTQQSGSNAADAVDAMDSVTAESESHVTAQSVEQLEHSIVELKRELYRSHAHTSDRIAHLEHVEHLLVDENLRLRRRVQLLELERSRTSLNRHHSESESSLDAGMAEQPSDAAASHGHIAPAERRNTYAPCPSPMNVDRPGSAGPIPVRYSNNLAVQTGLPPPQSVAAPRQSPPGHYESLQLQLAANPHVSQSPVGSAPPIRSGCGVGVQSDATAALAQSAATMPRVCRECGTLLVVYASSVAGCVSGTLNGGVAQCSGSARASVSSLTGLLAPTPPGAPQAQANAFRD